MFDVRRTLRTLLPLAVLAAGLVVAVGAAPAQAAVAQPQAGCQLKPHFSITKNANGFVDQGASYTVSGTVYPGTRITVKFLNNANGVELFRHVTVMAPASGMILETATLSPITQGTTVLPHLDYVCNTTGEVKGVDANTFRMQPEIICPPPVCDDPCRTGICTGGQS